MSFLFVLHRELAVVVSADRRTACHSHTLTSPLQPRYPHTTACTRPISSVNGQVSAASEDYFSKMQCHFQEFDWNLNRRALFSVLLPIFESIDGSTADTVFLLELCHTNAEIWFIFSVLQKSWLKKQGKNPCLNRCWISYLPILAHRGILIDRSDNSFPKTKAWFLMLIPIQCRVFSRLKIFLLKSISLLLPNLKYTTQIDICTSSKICNVNKTCPLFPKWLPGFLPGIKCIRWCWAICVVLCYYFILKSKLTEEGIIAVASVH